jgi:hypothetical protein
MYVCAYISLVVKEVQRYDWLVRSPRAFARCGDEPYMCTTLLTFIGLHVHA